MAFHVRMHAQDTIVARSTPAGAGAIAIVRLSGSHALEVARGLNLPATLTPYRLTRARPQDGHQVVLDDALVALMPGPHSYTGEDLLELHLHGSDVVVQRVLDACVALGARLAEPGEFTLRAFLHGRLDLAQAEAVGGLIHAQDEAAQEGALAVLGGSLSRDLEGWLNALEGVAADWLAHLDFPDDTNDAAIATPAHRALCLRVQTAVAAQHRRIAAAALTRRDIVLMGAVNTGKSTLLNTWAGYERALVDNQAGTTRDAIELSLKVGPVTLHIWDTAGRRDAATGVEARGIALGIERAAQSALGLWMLDAAAPVWPELGAPGALWLVGAQADRFDEAARQRLAEDAAARGTPLWGWVSGVSGEGSQPLLDALVAHVRTLGADTSEAQAMGNARHASLLEEASESLCALAAASAEGQTLDILLSELQAAIRALGQIVGRDVDARVIDRIFSDFCIGK